MLFILAVFWEIDARNIAIMFQVSFRIFELWILLIRCCRHEFLEDHQLLWCSHQTWVTINKFKFLVLLITSCLYWTSIILAKESNWNNGLVSSGVSLTTWWEGASSAFIGNASSDGITMKIPYGVLILLHLLASHHIFSYWVG